MVRSKIVNMATATSVAALSFAIPQTPVYAQTAPVVDVCTGLSLNESDLTALLGEVNTGIVTPLQTNLNGLLGPLSTLLLPGLPSPLNINVGDIVGNAVAGDSRHKARYSDVPNEIVARVGNEEFVGTCGDDIANGSKLGSSAGSIGKPRYTFLACKCRESL